jgi:hypothetical protein
MLSITYDGAYVQYLRSAGGASTLLRKIAAPSNLTLFFDSSYYSPGSALALIRFGPQSKVSDIGTVQVTKNAISVIQYAQDLGGHFNVQTTLTVAAADIPTGSTTVPVVVIGCVHQSQSFAFGVSRNETGTFAGTTPTLLGALPGVGMWTPTVVDNVGVGTHYYRFGFIDGSNHHTDDFTTVNGNILLLSITAQLAKR